MKKTLIIVLSLLNIGNVFAQEEGFTFSLKEAQEFAVQNNKNLMNTQKDIEIADEQYKIARGAGLPQVNAKVDYMTYFNYEFALDFGGGESTQPEINQALLDAGDFEVLSFINQAFGSSGSSTIKMNDQSSANLQISQLIFSAQYWVGLKMAKLAKEIAEKNVLATELGVKETVSNLYFGIVATHEYLRIIDNMLQNNKEVLKRTSDMYEKGLAEEVEVDQFRMIIFQLENSKKSMERSIEYTMNTFRFVLGIDSKNEIILTENFNILLQGVLSENSLEKEFDILNNPTYQILESQEKIGEKNISMNKWAYAPTLAGYYSYTEKILTTAFDLSPKSAAGFTLSIPIVSGGTRIAELNKAKIELDKINRNKLLLEEQLNLQNNQLKYELRNALDNYQMQKENTNISKRVYENINNKYKQGLVSSLDLTLANNNYLQAENNYITAILNLLQAKLNMDKLYNNL